MKIAPTRIADLTRLATTISFVGFALYNLYRNRYLVYVLNHNGIIYDNFGGMAMVWDRGSYLANLLWFLGIFGSSMFWLAVVVLLIFNYRARSKERAK